MFEYIMGLITLPILAVIVLAVLLVREAFKVGGAYGMHCDPCGYGTRGRGSYLAANIEYKRDHDEATHEVKEREGQRWSVPRSTLFPNRS